MAKNTKELSAEEKLQNRISGFFERNAKTLLICAASLVVLVAIIVTVTAVSSANREKAMVRIQSLEETVVGAYAGMEDSDKAAVISSLEAEEKGKNYVSFKASYLKGLAYFQDEKYQSSYDAFMACVSKKSDSYLAPIALVNAAAAQEALGNTTEALDLYNRVTSDYKESGMGAKALFNTGRIYFQQGNTALALSVFNQLIDKYPSSEYSALAKNIVSVN